jgi:hypothetical protein
MSPPAPPIDPRLRPFRAAAWAVYLLVAVGFSGLIVFSVFRSVLAMTPERPSASGPLLPVGDCVLELRALVDRLDAQRQDFSRPPATDADQRFLAFRGAWLGDKRALEARCGPGAPGREPLGRAFDDLERLLELSATSSVQFAGGVGPTFDALRERLEQAGR